MDYLVRKAQKGSNKAYLTLFQKYEHEVYKIAFIYVNNQNDALDVVQETAYRSFKSIKELKEPKYFKTWLIKIAINCSLDILRRRKNVVQMKPKFEEYISVDVDEEIVSEITVQNLIQDLTEDEKSVIILRFYDDLTVKEVAETLNIPLGSAKTTLYRALNKLRKKMKGDDINEQ